MIVCPGGAYGYLSEKESANVAKWLNGLGISAFVLKYRVAPNRFPAAFEDVKRAIRYVRYNAETWNIDPGRVGIIGFSAGGHLAGMAATHFDDDTHTGEVKADEIDSTSARPDVAVLSYPVITFAGEHRHEGSMVNLLRESVIEVKLMGFQLIGGSPERSLLEYLSLEKNVRETTPPTFLWHTVEDEIVSVENSILYAQALRERGVPFEVHLFPKGPHGLNLAKEHPDVSVWTSLCERWLRHYGW